MTGLTVLPKLQSKNMVKPILSVKENGICPFQCIYIQSSAYIFLAVLVTGAENTCLCVLITSHLVGYHTFGEIQSHTTAIQIKYTSDATGVSSMNLHDGH
jgi:hypothetical protein